MPQPKSATYTNRSPRPGSWHKIQHFVSWDESALNKNPAQHIITGDSGFTVDDLDDLDDLDRDLFGVWNSAKPSFWSANMTFHLWPDTCSLFSPLVESLYTLNEHPDFRNRQSQHRNIFYGGRHYTLHRRPRIAPAFLGETKRNKTTRNQCGGQFLQWQTG